MLTSGYEQPGWILEGGTSTSAPIVAGTIAMAPPKTRTLGAAAFYDQAFYSGTGNLNPVPTGSNGSCGSYLRNGGRSGRGRHALRRTLASDLLGRRRSELGVGDGGPQQPQSVRLLQQQLTPSRHLELDRTLRLKNHWNWTEPTGWNYYSIGGKAAASASPLAIRDAASTSQFVYFLKSGGGIGSWSWQPGVNWTYGEP